MFLLLDQVYHQYFTKQLNNKKDSDELNSIIEDTAKAIVDDLDSIQVEVHFVFL